MSLSGSTESVPANGGEVDGGSAYGQPGRRALVRHMVGEHNSIYRSGDYTFLVHPGGIIPLLGAQGLELAEAAIAINGNLCLRGGIIGPVDQNSRDIWFQDTRFSLHERELTIFHEAFSVHYSFLNVTLGAEVILTIRGTPRAVIRRLGAGNCGFYCDNCFVRAENIWPLRNGLRTSWFNVYRNNDDFSVETSVARPGEIEASSGYLSQALVEDPILYFCEVTDAAIIRVGGHLLMFNYRQFGIYICLCSTQT